MTLIGPGLLEGIIDESFYGNGFYLYDATYTLTAESYGQINFNGGNSALEINDVIASGSPQQFADTYPGAVNSVYDPVYVKHRLISGSAWNSGPDTAQDTWHVVSGDIMQAARIGTNFTNVSRYWIAEANDGTLIRASAEITITVTP